MMFHYWKKLFPTHNDWDTSAVLWGSGDDYLKNIYSEYDFKKNDRELKYPIYQEIPQNYRPPSRYNA